jgi:hypothetical protein
MGQPHVSRVGLKRTLEQFRMSPFHFHEGVQCHAHEVIGIAGFYVTLCGNSR